MTTRLQEKVAKAMYDCANTGDSPPWEEAEDHTRNWLLGRATAAINAVHNDLEMFVTRNLTADAADIANMLIARLRG
jgi:hypothetical protein